MVVMDAYIDNFYAFKNFHINFSYPKKAVNSYIPEEYIKDRKNFRYKKAVVLMGSNATGKTSLGRILLIIFNFIAVREAGELRKAVGDHSHNAEFKVDMLLSEDPVLYRIRGLVTPPKSKDETAGVMAQVTSTSIGLHDSYEKCAERLNEIPVEYSSDYEKMFSTLSLGWAFVLTENKRPAGMRYDFSTPESLEILNTVLKTLDSSIVEVRRSMDMENTYIIQLEHDQAIIKGAEIYNSNVLSEGTANGVDVADIMAKVLRGNNGFYYCDEKFKAISSEIEKACLITMVSALKPYNQLIFTTHNADILEVPYPKHTFMFLQRDLNDADTPIKVVSASDYIKRNTDSVRNAFENDLFSIIPNADKILEIGDDGSAA